MAKTNRDYNIVEDWRIRTKAQDMVNKDEKSTWGITNDILTYFNLAPILYGDEIYTIVNNLRRTK